MAGGISSNKNIAHKSSFFNTGVSNLQAETATEAQVTWQSEHFLFFLYQNKGKDKSCFSFILYYAVILLVGHTWDQIGAYVN